MKKILFISLLIYNNLSVAQNVSLLKCETDGVIEYRMPKNKELDSKCSNLAIWVDTDRIKKENKINEKAEIKPKTSVAINSTENKKVSFTNDKYQKRYNLLNLELENELEKKNNLEIRKSSLPEDEYLTALSIINENISSLKKELGNNIATDINFEEPVTQKAPESLPTSLPDNNLYLKTNDSSKNNTPKIENLVDNNSKKQEKVNIEKNKQNIPNIKQQTKLKLDNDKKLELNTSNKLNNTEIKIVEKPKLNINEQKTNSGSSQLSFIEKMYQKANNQK